MTPTVHIERMIRMEEILLDISLEKPVGKLEEAMVQIGYELKGQLKYDYPHIGHKFYERIRTGLYEKDKQLFYFAGIPKFDGDNIAVIRIGKIENKIDKNPECIFI